MAISFVAPLLLNSSMVSFLMIIVIIPTVIIEIRFLADSNPLFHSRVSWQIRQTHLSLLLRLLLLFYFTFISLFPCEGSHSADPRRHSN